MSPAIAQTISIGAMAAGAGALYLLWRNRVRAMRRMGWWPWFACNVIAFSLLRIDEGVYPWRLTWVPPLELAALSAVALLLLRHMARPGPKEPFNDHGINI